VGKSGVLEHKSGNISERRKDRGKVTMDGLQGVTNALLNGAISDPYALPFPRLEVRNNHLKPQSPLSQEWVKLQTSNFVRAFICSIGTKAG